MPANLTPEFQKAQKWFRSASTDEEKLDALEEMLRTIPKHKGTDHMQADIKAKISRLRKTSESKKQATSHSDIFYIPPQGAGQVALTGTPNSGKSSILGSLSNAPVKIENYPFSSDAPVPGMVYHQDVAIQMIDTPPVTEDYAPAGLVNTLRNADLIAVVLDISADPLDQYEICTNYLDSHRLMQNETAPVLDSQGNNLARPAFIIAAKSDAAPPGTLQTFTELVETNLDIIKTSTNDQSSLKNLTEKIFNALGIVRVYAKKPGHQPDTKDPFTLKKGSTVQDLATLIHRELGEKLVSARAWGTDVYDGQNVQKNHQLHDKDIIELHFP
jgi:hypothetical protein